LEQERDDICGVLEVFMSYGTLHASFEIGKESLVLPVSLHEWFQLLEER